MTQDPRAAAELRHERQRIEFMKPHLHELGRIARGEASKLDLGMSPVQGRVREDQAQAREDVVVTTPRPRWTLLEDARLRELKADGLGEAAIAEVLGKTSAAVRNRMSRLH